MNGDSLKKYIKTTLSDDKITLSQAKYSLEFLIKQENFDRIPTTLIFEMVKKVLVDMRNHSKDAKALS
jgi:hypothetical protein